MTDSGDTPQARGLFDAHLYLCDRAVRAFERQYPGMAEHEELLNFARMGLMEASRRFEAERGIPFYGYAPYRISGAIMDGVRRLGPLPRRAYQKLRALEGASKCSEGVLAEVFGEEPAPTAPGDYEQRLSDHLARMATGAALGLLSLRDDQAPCDAPDDVVSKSQLLSMVHAELRQLTDVEQSLLTRHYLGEETIEGIAQDLDISKSWASRLLSRAVGKITKRLQGKH